eukprot:TRINITY_DN16_c0_g2_i3.p1 TRINITY_DN16_c0_g2~~TRINITY_DN16_c0_g2_i3.p1  ORF type:complete len:1198 (-),score=204.75 TRINITY_DN16_c0_g2_i3:685-4278(-)
MSAKEVISEQRLAFLKANEKKVVLVQAVFRARRAKRSVAKLRKQIEHRASVARELLATEEIYVKNLETVVRVFITPLRSRIVDQKPIITAKELRYIFSDLEVILNVNSRLLSALTPRVHKWSEKQTIGDIFLKMTGFLKVYTQFVKDYNSALATIRSCSARPEFKSFLQQAASDPAVGKTQLSSFLILPVQRIPRYEMLLGDLLKHTREDHKDKADLSKAVALIHDVATYVDQKKFEAESVAKVTEIQSTFVGKFGNLAEPHRRFIRQDLLTILNTKKDNQFFLFNDMILLTKPIPKTSQFKYKLSYPLKDISFRDPHDDDDEAIFEFVIKDRDGVSVLRVKAESLEVKQHWQKEISKAKEEWNRRRNTLDATYLEVHGKSLQEGNPKQAPLIGWDVDAEKADTPRGRASSRAAQISAMATAAFSSPSSRKKGSHIEMSSTPHEANTIQKSPSNIEYSSSSNGNSSSPVSTSSNNNNNNNYNNYNNNNNNNGIGKKLRNFFSFRVKKPTDVSIKSAKESMDSPISNKSTPKSGSRIAKQEAPTSAKESKPNDTPSHQRTNDSSTSTSKHEAPEEIAKQLMNLEQQLKSEKMELNTPVSITSESPRETITSQSTSQSASQSTPPEPENKEPLAPHLETDAFVTETSGVPATSLADKSQCPSATTESDDDVNNKPQETTISVQQELQSTNETAKKTSESEPLLDSLNVKQSEISEQEDKVAPVVPREPSTTQADMPSVERDISKKEAESFPSPNASSPSQRRRSKKSKKSDVSDEKAKKRKSRKKKKESVGPKCSGCNKEINKSGVEVMALGKLWHAHCLLCHSCKQILTSSFVSRDGNAYCTTCEEELFATKCKGCDKGIKTGYVEVGEGEMWHAACFVCNKCQKQLGDFVEYQNKYFCPVTCDPCSPTCAACSLPMGRERIEALSKIWHPNCLVCSSCSKSLKNSFVERDDKAFCLGCVTSGKVQSAVDDTMTTLCSGCGMQLFVELEELITIGERKWHSLCLSCEVCHAPISLGNSHKELDSRIYCLRCSVPCKKCNKPCGPNSLQLPDKDGSKESWHKDCFRCSSCDSTLRGVFVEMKGMPYCENCFDKLQQENAMSGASGDDKTCCHCSSSIQGRYVAIADRQWHSSCFVCSKCSQMLENEYYGGDENRPLLCTGCYKSSVNAPNGYLSKASSSSSFFFVSVGRKLRDVTLLGL